ncbi:hypothetical protein [Solirubrobacter deserti]|uniref:PLL-like beta propeller domain-containing protein n=1 Tax=Solirubrobacter deserti TaxID=2282478 RepID=A0ABT4RN46_9ACTN|nr:hypothetical protein [Solirubrobacter deserti]MDA0139984.1 hypothetical protein [Solirubrobacter deserti]
MALAVPARADVYDDNPATASRGPGDAWIFARGADGTILERHLSNGAWTDWSSIGGQPSSGPAAVAAGGNIHVFVRGAEGALWEKVFSAGAWSNWVSLGGYLTSAPGATVRRGVESIDVAVRAGDNSIVMRSRNPGGPWQDWEYRGGHATSAPALDSWSPDQLNVWTRAPQGSLGVITWDDGAWTSWQDLGGAFHGAPAAVSRMPNVQNVYVRATDSTLAVRSWSLTGHWTPWVQFDPRPVTSSPAAAADGPHHEWVVARGGTGLLYREWRGSWSAWTDMGPVAVPAPPPPPPASPPAPSGDVNLQTGLGCTPVGGQVRVRIAVRQTKQRVVRIVFFTKGKGREVRTDRKAPFDVRLKVNRPAGKSGRIYARIYYRTSAKGKLRRKTVTDRYTVCR